jgi:hypothetical protein
MSEMPENWQNFSEIFNELIFPRLVQKTTK